MSEMLDARKQAAATWFQTLRDQICDTFEAIEDAHTHGLHAQMPAGRFVRTPWERTDQVSGAPGGGGVMSVMKGRVFEKVGVNISTVNGTFAPDFAKSVKGAAQDPRFFATGISVVAHMRSPLVPAVHMNTRFLVTTEHWFGGGSDLNPPLPNAEDTRDFLAAFEATCDRYNSSWYAKYKEWCDTYFYVPHRNRARGVGGIFYDHHNSGNFETDFAFTQDVGKTFLQIYPELVRRHQFEDFTPAERDIQLIYRGLYAEFNLVYDRGTLFGLKTNGNVDAILMSLPPEAKWP
jgi:coproporphyrinogen III oxidase